MNNSKVVNPEDMLRVLFVCSYNFCRSPTAEVLFRSLHPYLWVRSAGLAALSTNPATRNLCNWAHRIYCFEHTHEVELQQFNTGPGRYSVVNLNIPDVYAPCDPELVELLTARLRDVLLADASAVEARVNNY